MPTYLKIISAIVIVLALVLLGWWYFGTGIGANAPVVATSTEATTTQEAPINQSPDINSSTDSSDASLDQDLLAVDGQIKDLGIDSSAVETSLKNQAETPVQ